MNIRFHTTTTNFVSGTSQNRGSDGNVCFFSLSLSLSQFKMENEIELLICFRWFCRLWTCVHTLAFFFVCIQMPLKHLFVVIFFFICTFKYIFCTFDESGKSKWKKMKWNKRMKCNLRFFEWKQLDNFKRDRGRHMEKEWEKAKKSLKCILKTSTRVT